MSLSALTLLADAYPQKRDGRDLSWLDRQWERLRTAISARWRITPAHLQRFAADVDQAESQLQQLAEEARHADLVDTRRALRRQGPRGPAVARAFAHVRLASHAVLGLRHFHSQLKGGYILLKGSIAEMDTGEGKTLTATLAAATMALSGRAVHIITVNDYLARRDAEQMGPVFAALGLSTGLVLESMDAEAKRTQYRADIVYCTSKIVAFDYLRDRIDLGPRMKPLRMALDALSGGQGGRTMLRGLQFTIVDEADSVLIDEARTPLIISRATPDPTLDAFHNEAMNLARRMTTPEHYEVPLGSRTPWLTETGRAWLAEQSQALDGLWRGRMRREEAIGQALSALHGFTRDIDYIVREDKVMIVDENTGRVMPDRSWERGLQQLVEIKEGVPPSPPKQTLARISFQMFFRRYLVLAGMTGTCREVAGEIGEIYGLPVVRVQPNKPSRRRELPRRLFVTADERWQAVVDEVQLCRRQGQPVLVGTRSIMASEVLAARLQAQGIPHRVLNAKQDDEEAAIVALAGQPGCVTIATNMAGRGTDIKLAEGVDAVGGLHVIVTEGHDNARVDRQLVGRCARQGDAGTWRTLWSLEDELLSDVSTTVTSFLKTMLRQKPDSVVWQKTGMGWYRLAQWRVERAHRGVRRRLLKSDLRLRQSLSFSGQME